MTRRAVPLRDEGLTATDRPTRDQRQGPVPLIGDPTGPLTRNFEALIEEEGLALRGILVIDLEGQIKLLEMHDNGIDLNATELLRKVKATQHVAVHPNEMCPAKWTRGEETPKLSLDLVGTTAGKRRAALGSLLQVGMAAAIPTTSPGAQDFRRSFPSRKPSIAIVRIGTDIAVKNSGLSSGASPPPFGGAFGSRE